MKKTGIFFEIVFSLFFMLILLFFIIPAAYVVSTQKNILLQIAVSIIIAGCILAIYYCIKNIVQLWAYIELNLQKPFKNLEEYFDIVKNVLDKEKIKYTCVLGKKSFIKTFMPIPAEEIVVVLNNTAKTKITLEKYEMQDGSNTYNLLIKPDKETVLVVKWFLNEFVKSLEKNGYQDLWLYNSLQKNLFPRWKFPKKIGEDFKLEEQIGLF